MTSTPITPGLHPKTSATPLLEGTIADIAGFLVPRVGDLCVVATLEPDGTLHPVEIAASDPTQAELMRRNLLAHPLHISQTARLTARAAASGQTVFVPNADPDYVSRYTLHPGHREQIAEYRPRSIMIVPLTADSRVLGTVALTSNTRRFDPGDLRLLEEFAGRMALLLDHAEARRRATRSLDLLQRLQRLAEPLISATTPDHVVDLIVPELVTTTGAIGGGVLLPDAGERFLESRRVTGDYDRTYLSRFHRIPLADALAAGPGSPDWYPAHEAWRTGRSVLIACLGDWRAGYHLAPRLLGPGGDASWAVLPMRGRERVVGLITLTFPTPGPLAPDQLAFMEAAADQCGAALERIEAEQALAEREARLLQTAKLEAIGRLAGGLAHEFRNQLQAILGFAGYVAQDPGLGDGSRDDLRQITWAGQRLATLTSQLLAFSRQQMLEPTTLDLNAALAETLPMLRQLIGSNTRMTTQLSRKPLWVRADQAQLQQVVTNLVVNARDAMPEGGDLLIRSESRVLPDASGHASDIPPGRYVVLTVKDNGSGIPPEDMPHIFEPFFTTKPVGQGTGLGLASVHGIVAQSQGFVNGVSDVGIGTTMTIFLPEVEPAAAGAPAEPPKRSATGPTGSVLVVEDEELVLRLLVRLLQDDGHHTLTAGTGPEALAVLEANPGAVDLILSDVVMPETRPSELARAYATRFGEVPVLWMSGFPADLALQEHGSGESTNFLQKPVDGELLLARVAELLRERAAKHAG